MDFSQKEIELNKGLSEYNILHQHIQKLWKVWHDTKGDEDEQSKILGMINGAKAMQRNHSEKIEFLLTQKHEEWMKTLNSSKSSLEPIKRQPTLYYKKN